MRLVTPNTLGFSARGLDVLQLTAPALAVNFLTILAAVSLDITGVQISVAGSDTDIDLDISAKGSGEVTINTSATSGDIVVMGADRLFHFGAQGAASFGTGSSSPTVTNGLVLELIHDGTHSISRMRIKAPNLGEELSIGIGNITEDNGAAFFKNLGSSDMTFHTSAGEFLRATGLDVRFLGNLIVDGTTTSINTETVNVADNHFYLNSGYTAVSAQTGGLVVSYLPTATATTVSAGAFVAGVASASNPTVGTVGVATFSAGDIVQISATNVDENDGLFEVLTHAANLLTIRGVGTVAPAEDFTGNQFVANASDNATITKVTVSVLRTGTDGVWEAASGSSTGLIFADLIAEGDAPTFDATVTIKGVLGTTLTGIVSVTAGTATVTGLGTLFESQLVEGSALQISGELFTVSTIIDNNNLTLDSNHSAGASNVSAFTDGTLLSIISADGGELFNFSPLGITGTILSDANSNTRIGTETLLKITTASFNTMMGHFAGKGITTGNTNVGRGSGALQSLVSGSQNVAIGGVAAFDLTGNSNIAIGSAAMSGATAADNNIVIGASVASTLTTGDNNILIGAGTEPASPTASNETVIGNSSTVSAIIKGAVSIPGTLSVTGNIIAPTLSGTVTGPSGTWNIGGMDLALGDVFAIDGIGILSAVQLGTTVLASSLTSVGTLTGLAVSGDVILTPVTGDAELIINNSVGTEILKVGHLSASGFAEISSSIELIISTDADDLVLFSNSGNVDLSTSTGEIIINSTSGNLKFQTAIGDISFNTNALFLDRSTNRVGIGTVAPQQSFDIAGSLAVSESYNFSDGSTQGQGATIDGFGWHLSTALFKQSIDVSTNAADPFGVFFKPDGLKMYVISPTTNNIAEYDLPVAWDSASRVFLRVGSVSQDASQNDLFIRSDGLKVFTIGEAGNRISEYTLSIAWDISTISFVQFFIVSGQSTSPQGIDFKPDGLVMYMSASGEINQYALTTAWDLSDVSFTKVNTVFANGTRGTRFKPDGAILYEVGSTVDAIKEYAVATPWDIAELKLVNSFAVGSEDTAPQGIFIKPDGSKTYMVGSTNDNVYEYDLGLQVEGNFSDGTNVGKLSFNPPNVIEIHSAEDLDALAVAGVINIATNTTLVIKAAITTANVFSQTTGDLTLTGDFAAGVGLTYSGTGTFFTIKGDVSLRLKARCSITASSTGTLFDYTSSGELTGIVIDDCSMTGWNLGTMRRGGLIMSGNAAIILHTAPLILKNSHVDGNDVILFAGASVFEFEFLDPSTTVFPTVFNNLNGFSMFAAPIRIDPLLLSDATYQFNVISTGSVSIPIFDTAGVAGTFTNVVDNSIGSTSITSVTDTTGSATFNHSGTDPIVGSQIVISGYITNTAYNGTFIVATSSAGSFTVEDGYGIDVVFGTDEVGGSYAVTGITLTSTAHGLLDNQTLRIDTDLSTDYDGGYRIYNASANAFDVATAFTLIGIDTGTWDTSGLDESSIDVLVTGASTNRDSRNQSFGFTNDNSMSTTVTDETYAAIDVSGFSQEAVSEGFKLTNSGDGKFTLTAIKDFAGFMTGSLSALKTGSTANYRFAMSTNGAIPTFATANYVPMEVKTTKVNIALQFSVELSKGDTIQIMVAGDGTSNSLTITDLVFGIQ